MAHLTIPNFNIPSTSYVTPIGLIHRENPICFLEDPESALAFKGFFVEEVAPYFKRTEEIDTCPVTVMESPHQVKDAIVNKGFSELINQDSSLRAEITTIITDIQSLMPRLGVTNADVMNFISLPYFLFTEGETVESFYTHVSQMSSYMYQMDRYIKRHGLGSDVAVTFHDSYVASQNKILKAIENHEEILMLADFGLPFLPPEIKSLSFLKHITLNNNSLTEFPKEILGFKNLMGLYIRNNHLKAVPPELTQFKFLILADFSGNMISPDRPLPDGVISVDGFYKVTLSEHIPVSQNDPLIVKALFNAQ